MKRGKWHALKYVSGSSACDTHLGEPQFPPAASMAPHSTAVPEVRIIRPMPVTARPPVSTFALIITVMSCVREPNPVLLRVATFNASLFRDSPGALTHDLTTKDDSQAIAVAQIIQRVRPDVILINEFDYDEAGRAAQLFQANYLAISHTLSGAEPSQPITYPHRLVEPVNTGVPSGLDLDNDGAVGRVGSAYAGDALGFGQFPGQYGMLLLSRFPIDTANVRTFRTLLWRDMPGALLPTGPDSRPWYDEAELAALPLSSKSHWDVPIVIGNRVLHVLASHPTPPIFDGDEDRNGRRNHDEIRFWADYLTPNDARYIYDDRGIQGGLAADASFVILGDLNADPYDGDSTDQPAGLLLSHPRVNVSRTPSSEGGVEQHDSQGGNNTAHRGNPAFDTADFADRGSAPGNLRIDYVLPSADLGMVDAQVFWPRQNDVLFKLVGTFPFPASDHRLVWVDLALDDGS